MGLVFAMKSSESVSFDVCIMVGSRGKSLWKSSLADLMHGSIVFIWLDVKSFKYFMNPSRHVIASYLLYVIMILRLAKISSATHYCK